jgi:flagellar basal-body rod protein FlgB
MNIVGDTRIGLIGKALDGLAQRQQAIAGNIANVDTPGYQRRDVDFESSLRANMGGGNYGLAQFDAPSEPSLLSLGTGASARTGTTRNDGNNVDIDYEMTQLAETSLRYELLSQAAGARFGELQNIIGRSA